jgi:hypothetical protein
VYFNLFQLIFENSATPHATGRSGGRDSQFEKHIPILATWGYYRLTLKPQSDLPMTVWKVIIRDISWGRAEVTNLFAAMVGTEHLWLGLLAHFMNDVLCAA